MSNRLINETYALRGLPPTQKSVLALYANHANADGRAWQSADTTMGETGLRERCVRGAIQALREQELLVPDGHVRGSVRYVVCPQNWKGERAPGAPRDEEKPEPGPETQPARSAAQPASGAMQPARSAAQPARGAPKPTEPSRTNNNPVVDCSFSEMEEKDSRSNEEMLEALQQVRDHYCEVTGDRNSFHPREESMGMERLAEALKMREGDLGEAVELMQGAIDTVDSWPKRSGPVKWRGIFVTTGTFEKWARDANDKLDRRPPPPMPKTQEELDATELVCALTRTTRLCHQPAGPSWTLGQEFIESGRVRQELERHVEGMPAQDAITLLNGLTSADSVRTIVGPATIPEQPVDIGEFF
jgi:hypothetical protein